ncbi:MAG: class I SAM-dependent methyltransferase [Patescibacteria group bacterium]
MEKQEWVSYWQNVENSFWENKIQAYKGEFGYKKLLMAVPEIKDKGRVLEVGAGKAWISRLLRARGYHSTCLDSDPDAVMLNSKMVDDYIIGDIFNLPFPEKSFDLVISCGLLEHFQSNDLKTIVSEMGNVSDTVIAWLPACDFKWQILWRFRNLINKKMEFPFAYQHKPEDLEKLFISLGFTEVKTGAIRFIGLFKYIYIYGHKN